MKPTHSGKRFEFDNPVDLLCATEFLWNLSAGIASGTITVNLPGSRLLSLPKMTLSLSPTHNKSIN